MMINTILNQIFYDINKFDVEPILFEQYMLSKDYIKTLKPISDIICNEIKVEDDEQVESIPKIKERHELFMPRVKDRLFCCIYIVNVGIGEYHMLGSRYKNVELQEKQNIMNFINKNKTHIKTTGQSNGVKITNVKLQNISSELMTDSKTTWYTFWVLCMYYKINAIIFQGKIYMEFVVDSVYDTYLFERNDDLQITVDFLKMNSESIFKIKNERLKIDPFIEKILKGVSSYKTSELQDMMNILQLHCGVEKPKKQDLYETLIKYMVSKDLQN